jgi:hypothetical protein
VNDGRLEKIVFLKKHQLSIKSKESLRFERENLGKTGSAITIQREWTVRL